MKTLFSLFLKSLSFVLVKSPRFVRTMLGDAIGVLWFDILRIRRKVVTDNLKKAFPEMDYPQRVKLGRESLCNLGRDIVEYSFLPFFDKKLCDDLFEFKDAHYMDEAIKKNKGVCVLTLHMGNGDLASAALSAVGYNIHLVSKEFKTKWLNDMWFAMRARAGTKFIPPRNSSYAILKALKKKENVIFVMDQFTGPPIGIRTQFFGIETGTGYGLAMMAERAKSPVIPVYTIRKNDGKHLIQFLPEIEFKEEESQEQTMVAMTQRYNSFIEDVVRKHPEQWMWVHKRWKTFREGKSRKKWTK